ncbi:polyphosphate--glucose phosphotransferase [Blastococcus sp. Marseille-P5729]|uniref:polyphosphate--glucose phosphotransferase n=1 Tax=Blastococcus sp. Marseille-P5729 TaxID=2086582 RepID=UPI000D0F2BF4|nr:ROK family protein [Blastococcus sp. Marseille-P5729]
MAARKPTVEGFGIDIGGSGIKGALVDLQSGELLSDRFRIDTPKPSTPERVLDVVAQVVAQAGHKGEVGITFPAVIQHGIARTAANIDQAWIGVDIAAVMRERLGVPVTVLNDADAAGVAEVRYGAGFGVPGTVLMLTFGTGIGSALLVDGVLVPNTELGHIEVDGKDGEKRASGSARETKGLSFEEWAGRVSRYLQVLEQGLWPDLIIVGGGVSKKADRWVPLLQNRTPIKVARLLNNAGIAGAALAAHEAAGGSATHP